MLPPLGEPVPEASDHSAPVAKRPVHNGRSSRRLDATERRAVAALRETDAERMSAEYPPSPRSLARSKS
jgi:hypothetical protein